MDTHNKNYIDLNFEAEAQTQIMIIYRETTISLKYILLFLQPKTHTGATLQNSKLNFVIIGRRHKAAVKVSAASAVPPIYIYIALFIGIADKETIGTICHSFIAGFFLLSQPAP